MNKNIMRAAAVVVVFVLAAGQAALAHKVNIFAFVDGDMIRSESYFPDGKACVNSKIIVKSPDDVTLLEGITDGAGMFSFKIPQETDLLIILDAGMGHRGEFFIKASELPEVVAPSGGEAVKAGAERRARRAGSVDANLAQETPSASHEDENVVIPAECREFLDPLIEEEIQTRVSRIMAESKWRSRGNVSPALVIGGFGYIIGVMGLWMFFLSKKNNKDRE